MARRSAPILLALGIVLAIATGGLIYYLLQQAAPATADTPIVVPTAVPTRPLPVAGRVLPAGTEITTTDVITRDYPIDLLPVGVLTDTGALMGKVLTQDVQEGEFFRPIQLGEANNAPLSMVVPPGKVAMAFSREDLLNKSTMIREGDHLDLLLTVNVKEESATETREGKVTTYTLQNIEVLRLVRPAPTTDNPNPDVSAVLFLMDPQDVVIAKWIKDSDGVLDFSLRSRGDTATFDTSPINQDYFFDEYGVRAPVSSTKPK